MAVEGDVEDSGADAEDFVLELAVIRRKVEHPAGTPYSAETEFLSHGMELAQVEVWADSLDPVEDPPCPASIS